MSHISLHNAWTTVLPIEDTRQKLGLFLDQNGMKMLSSENDCFQAQQDVPVSAGEFGGQASSGTDFSKRVNIQIIQTASGTSVDATVEDTTEAEELLPAVKEQRELDLKTWMWGLFNLLPVEQSASTPAAQPQEAAPQWTVPPAQSYQAPQTYQPAQAYPPAQSYPPAQGYQSYTVPPAPAVQQQPFYAARPTKDRSTAMLLEILPDLFGLYGFGWIYGGNTSAGIFWLIGGLVWDLIAGITAALTVGVSLFCTLPINILLIVLSAVSLNSYMKKHPEIFGV